MAGGVFLPCVHTGLWNVGFIIIQCGVPHIRRWLPWKGDCSPDPKGGGTQHSTWGPVGEQRGPLGGGGEGGAARAPVVSKGRCVRLGQRARVASWSSFHSPRHVLSLAVWLRPGAWGLDLWPPCGGSLG